MIALILTLFISLFSYCPSVNTIEDHEENIILERDLVAKNAFTDDWGYTYVGLSEFGDFTFYQAFMSNIASNGYVGSSNVTYDDFRNGYPTTISGLTLQLGTMDNSAFTYIRDITSIQLYHEYLSDYATRTKFTFYNASGAADYVVRGYYCFNDLTLRNCINNVREVLGTTGDPFAEVNICLRWRYADYANLFPYLGNESRQYDYGYQAGYSDGESAGYNTGYQAGYGIGYTDGSSVDATASTIFTGILDVALIPVNVFLTIFNFEVFGINIAGIVSALLTISVVVIIIRFVTGKKDD